MKLFLKQIVENFPYRIGSALTLLPFSCRLGREYTKFEIRLKDSTILPEQYIIQHFANIFKYAKANIPFYQNLYKNKNIFNLEISTIEDIKQLPIISKDDVRKHLNEFNGAIKLNTGGTSGESFSFYVDKNAFAREWAHMHHIWRIKGYNYTDLKVTLRGKDLGDKNIIYNPVHNEFILNTYKNAISFKSEIINLFKKRKIKYLHGYPSAIYNFLTELDSVISKEEKGILKSNLKACFLGSEFPMPHITAYLESKWQLDYISWYGHSEMCILAYDELKINTYKPFHTYGYAEVVDEKLIGTSFHNFDMPLIRYDTGDIVEPTYSDDGLLSYFKITQGRNGDYIIDKNNKQIPLTALIFGRHHRAFNFAKFIQVSQKKIGEVTFYITTTETNFQKINSSLNLENIDIDYKIQAISKPYKTNTGKVKLKI